MPVGTVSAYKQKGGRSRLSVKLQTGLVDLWVKLAAFIALEHVFQVDYLDF